MTGGVSAASSTQERAFRYGFGPFQLHSDIELPMLAPDAEPDAQDQGNEPIERLPVHIRLRSVGEKLPEAAAHTSYVRASSGSSLMVIPGVARYLVTGGREVLVDIVPGAPMIDVRSYLLGWVFGVLCHQNGLLPLHASAIESGGAVTAFLGQSGVGKSTLAAFLQRRGYPLVSDDICLVQPRAQGMRVIPVAGWLKLWRESLDTLGQTPDPGTQTFLSQDKYRILLAARPMAHLPMTNLVFPERGGEGLAPSLERLSTAQAIARMLETVYLGYLANAYGDGPRLFQQCAKVLAGASAYRLTVPTGFQHMPAVLDLLQAELLQKGAQGSGQPTSGQPS